MPVVNITEASKLVKKTRQTLYTHNKKGRLSFARMDDGSQGVDTTELERVYGKLHVTPEQLEKINIDTVNVKSDTIRQPLTPKNDSIDNELRIEVERLREQINSKNTENRLLSDQIEDLKEQRDKWEKQATNQTRLLTHEQERSQRLEQQPEPPQGFFKKLFGVG
jgi:TolA-binding protein